MLEKYLQELQASLTAQLSPSALLASSRAGINIYNMATAHELNSTCGNRQKRIDQMARLRRQCQQRLCLSSLDSDSRVIVATALLMLEFAPLLSIVDDEHENEALRLAWEAIDGYHPSCNAVLPCADVELLEALASQNPDEIECLLHDSIAALKSITLTDPSHVKLICRAIDLATLCGFASAADLDTVSQLLAAVQCTTPEQKLQLLSCRIAADCMAATQAISATALPA